MHQYLRDYFRNYEISKLDIFEPNLANLLLILLFIVVIVATINKNDSISTRNELLNISHTDQLRGLGIFFIILGHLWVHVSKTKPQIVLSGDAVSLFLLLSGFGLAVSTRNTMISFREFCLKRIKRVMYPYWIATIVILLFDLLVLEKTLNIDSLLMTLIGVNTRLELRNIDYVRWFVTFILLWYLLFYVVILKINNKYSFILLLGAAFMLLFLDYYIFHFGWYQFFSFPAGCLLALRYQKFLIIYRKFRVLFIILSTAGILYVLSFKILMSDETVYFIITQTVPYILLIFISEGNSILISVGQIIILGQLIERGLNSKVLLFFGKYSYEILLLHGAFLIKYNPIIRSQGTSVIIIQFLLFLAFVTILSFLSYKVRNSLLANETA